MENLKYKDVVERFDEVKRAIKILEQNGKIKDGKILK